MYYRKHNAYHLLNDSIDINAIIVKDQIIFNCEPYPKH